MGEEPVRTPSSLASSQSASSLSSMGGPGLGEAGRRFLRRQSRKPRSRPGNVSVISEDSK